MENSKNLFDDSIDLMIKYAGSAAADEIFDKIESSIPDESIVFSEKHIKAVNMIFDKERKRINAAKAKRRNIRFIIAAAVVMAFLMIFAMAVGAVREKIIELFNNVTSFNTSYSVNEAEGDSFGADIKLSIKYVPDNYEINEEYSTDTYSYARYANGDSYFIIEKYSDIDSYMLNTENAEYEKILVDGTEVAFTERDDLINAFWTKGGYVYNISGNIKMDAVIDLIKNIS